MRVKITRTRDNLTKIGELAWIKFKMDGNYTVDEPEEGVCLCLDPGFSFTWLTSPIIEVISPRHIRTKNSEYLIEEL